VYSRSTTSRALRLTYPLSPRMMSAPSSPESASPTLPGASAA